MSVMTKHQPVLLNEILTSLAIKPAGIYIDATFGRGGHSTQILAQLGSQGRLICIDQDPEAIAYGQELFKQDPRVIFVHRSFRDLTSIAKDLDISGKIDGILFDLGVSSPQLDNPERGFSFMKAGPLDMRMNPQAGQSASEWIMQATEREISDVLWKFGEEKFSRSIARNIVQIREQSPITTTVQLAEIIKNSCPFIDKHKHPATRSFQAIRIYINQELASLIEALEAASMVLKPGGRLSIISFHSLEDRIVKRYIRSKTVADLPARLPIKHKDIQLPFKAISKRIDPSAEEITGNPRSRSAHLRVMEKLSVGVIC